MNKKFRDIIVIGLLVLIAGMVLSILFTQQDILDELYGLRYEVNQMRQEMLAQSSVIWE